MGPLHSKDSVKEYEDGIAEIKKQGGKILYGGSAIKDKSGNFVLPTIVEIDWRAPIVKVRERKKCFAYLYPSPLFIQLGGTLRPNPLRDEIQHPGGGYYHQQLCSPGTQLKFVYQERHERFQVGRTPWLRLRNR